jgi:hypothetical protein
MFDTKRAQALHYCNLSLSESTTRGTPPYAILLQRSCIIHACPAPCSDWVFASPIAWALVAIGVQQRSGAYPGGAEASTAGFVLGGLLAAAAFITGVRRLWLWRKGKSAPFAAFADSSSELTANEDAGSAKLVDSAPADASAQEAVHMTA